MSVLAVLWLICWGASWYVGWAKGRAYTGFILGMVAGPLGLYVTHEQEPLHWLDENDVYRTGRKPS